MTTNKADLLASSSRKPTYIMTFHRTRYLLWKAVVLPVRAIACAEHIVVTASGHQ